jgi:hypothetical protein
MTAQVHEVLLLDGQPASIAGCPPIPRKHPRIVATDDNTPTSIDDWLLCSTACYRRYIGSWKLCDGRLYLTGLRGMWTLIGTEPLFAEWVSGKFRVPQGEIAEYVHLGFLTRFESELHILIKRGLVIDTRLHRYERKE